VFSYTLFAVQASAGTKAILTVCEMTPAPAISHSEPPLPPPTLWRDVMLLMLTWAAGNVDAISYLGLGHVFTAMMTGNTVLLGLALAQGEVRAVLRSIAALVGFAAGAAAGAWIVGQDGKREEWPPTVTAAFAVETGTLALFSVVWHLTGPARGVGIGYLLIVLSGLAMGIQAAAVRRIGVPGIATTYITGTLTSLLGDFISWLRSLSHPARAETGVADTASIVHWERRVRLLAAVFFAYGLGAFTGAVLQTRVSSLVTLPPLIAVATVVVNASVHHGR
jgi:uncharacterized membrane protein YoaK (UPF0700 family)